VPARYDRSVGEEVTPMTIDKFKKAGREYRRRTLIVIGLGAAVSAVTRALCVRLVHGLDLRAVYAARFGDTAAGVLMGLTLFPAVLVFVPVIWYGEQRSSRDPRIHCPHRERVISNQQDPAIATRNCPTAARGC
jgi:hypothetical protein